MTRRFFKYGIAELEKHVGSNLKNVEELLAVQAELKFRKRARERADRLARKIDHLLQEIRQSEPQHDGGPEGGGKAGDPADHEPGSSTENPSERDRTDYGTGGQSDLFEGSKQEDNGGTPSTDSTAADRNNSDGATVNSRDNSNRIDADDVDPGDDWKRPTQFSLISAPGVGGKPDAWVPGLDQDLDLGLSDSSTTIERYVAAIGALISEMRRSKSGQRRYELNDGQQTEMQGSRTIYVFAFTEEADIFDEAQVELLIGARRTRGQIVGLSNGQLWVALDDDLGPVIGRCVLVIDNTALLQALKERLEDAGQGEVQINTGLADVVVSDRLSAPAVPKIPVPHLPTDRPPNAGQSDAIGKMLSRSVTYLWGPPGTGKTRTLSIVVQAAFDARKRVLICSNTNQAVDQLISALCEHLEKQQHTALEDGLILRFGKTTDNVISPDHARFVTVEGVLERRSQALNQRKAAIEDELARIDRQTHEAQRVVSAFHRMDRAEEALRSLERARQEAKTRFQAARSEHEAALSKQRGLDEELLQRQNAGALRRVIMRSEERIEGDRRRARGEAEAAQGRSESAASEVRRLDAQLTSARDTIASLRPGLAGLDRARSEAVLEKAEEARQPLLAELQEIERKLADIAASILRDARVIGTTVTKAYLRVRDLGRFDMVIVDEASMVMLPALYFAAGLATERVVVSGDFRQLPPIVPTRQQAIQDEIGADAFEAAAVSDKGGDPRCAMLVEQYRMAEPICGLISDPMYGGRLKTASGISVGAQAPVAPVPFDRNMTVVDTSKLWPFESRNIFKSRFNLMHALLVRNLTEHLLRNGFDGTGGTAELGICTPYAAQARIHRQLAPENVIAGTVHRFQGDEKQAIILDLPESIGDSWNIGQFVQGLPPDHVGARLLNVAASRAKRHLIVFANLTYLEDRLPSMALTRMILHRMQQQGQVVDAEEVLKIRPVDQDLKRLLGIVELDLKDEQTGLFHSRSFQAGVLADMTAARSSIVVFSGFVTAGRVASYGGLFRQKIAEGVEIRCVTRPPHRNGSIPADHGKQALDALEGIGVKVDCRKEIHQKLVLVDKRIVWAGSLNPLSHTQQTDEFMMRIADPGLASSVAALVSINTGASAAAAAEAVARKENPACPDCGSRTFYADGPYGPYFKCEDVGVCNWSQSQGKAGGSAQKPAVSLPKAGPPCPKCNSKTRLRNGRYGPFYSCENYPRCKGKAKVHDTSG